ncbi:MAG TPA: PAC2 family protein [Methanocorpusculum sp.]|nr:PAC2 family protein [Methanocorpusculum sp.]
MGGIIDAAGLLFTLGHLHGMEGIALLGKMSGYLVDPVSSTVMLDVLGRLTQVRTNRMEPKDLAKRMKTEVEAIAYAAMSKSPVDLSLSYIG